MDDLALDLWGYPPRPAVTCPGCGQRAEPWWGRFCFLCSHAPAPGGRTHAQMVLAAAPSDYREHLLTTPGEG